MRHLFLPFAPSRLAFDRIEVKIMSFKIAIIGAGSVGFTKKLFTDILCVPEFGTSNSR
jgi:alpha-galactosidase